MFGITRSVSSEVQACTKELLYSFIRMETIKTICMEIAGLVARLDQTDDAAVQKQIKDRVSSLKKRLPAITPMATFRDGKRAVKNAIPSGLNMLDVDHIAIQAQAPQAPQVGGCSRDATAVCSTQAEKVTENIPPLGGLGGLRPEMLLRSVCDWDNIDAGIKDVILWIYMTPSTNGLRFIFVQPQGMTIEQGQRWMAEQLGIKQYDGVTKDLARLSFIVPEEYNFKLDDSLFGDWTMYAPVVKEPQATAPQAPLEGGCSKDATAASSTPVEKVTENIPPFGGLGGLDFHGVPYSSIISRLLLTMGYDGDPSEGERNTALYALTREMRYICDFNVQKLLHVLPHWGLPDGEVEATIRSALNTVRKTDVPAGLKRIIASLEADFTAAQRDTDDDGEVENDWEKLPKKLPRLLQLLVKAYPKEYRPAVVMSSIVALGTLLTRTRAEYIDGGVHSPSFLCCIVSHQASGKSFVRKIYELLTAPIKRDDEMSRQKLKLYKKEKEKAKNQKVQPVEPDVCIRLLPATASATTILKRADLANSKHISMFTEELDQLTKGEGQSWSKKSDILRQAFDNAEWGQDYQSDQSYSAMVKLYYNLICCATPHAMNRFFRDVEDGLVSRFIFCRLPDTLGAKAPHFGRFSRKDLEEIGTIVDSLYDNSKAVNENGEELPFDEGRDCLWIESRRLSSAIEDWLEGYRLEFLQNQENKALEIFRRRAAVIGFRAGLVGYILCGKQMNATAIALALWVAEYTLRNQLALFGEDMNRVMNEDDDATVAVNYMRNAKNVKLFDSLPDTFKKEEIVKIRANAGLSTDVRMIVSRWIKSGLIVKVERGVWKKLKLIADPS